MKYRIEETSPKIVLEVDVDEIRVILHGLNAVIDTEAEKLCDVSQLAGEVKTAVKEIFPPAKRRKPKHK